MLNIFQFLKQGTSLSRKALDQNVRLEQQILPQCQPRNDDFDRTNKFREDDSSEEEEGQSVDEGVIQAVRLKRRKQAQQACRVKGVKVDGLDHPLLLSNFTKMIRKYKIQKSLVRALQLKGYMKPTPVQMQVMPCLLEKRSVIVTAPTGTGKTLSFLLPVLSHLQRAKASSNIQAIVMAPLQELATQIALELALLAQDSPVKHRCMSQLTEDEKTAIQKGKPPGFNLLVTTPMAFLMAFKQSGKILKKVQFIVLDECDKYFEESFLSQIKEFLEIFKDLHPIYGLFSATIQHPVEELLREQFLEDCVRVQVGGKNKVLGKIEQRLEYCTNELGKLVFLRNLISEGLFVPPVLLFVQQKLRAKQLYFNLKKIMRSEMNESRRIEILTSDKSKDERQSILSNFEKGKFWVLITTDIVSRGIDFHNVNLVINYDFPNSMLTYVHRVGRTGRADRKGTALTLFTQEDKPMVRVLADLLTTSGCTIPAWMSRMPKASRQERKKLERFPVKRLPVGVASPKDKHWEHDLVKLTKDWERLRKQEQAKP